MEVQEARAATRAVTGVAERSANRRVSSTPRDGGFRLVRLAIPLLVAAVGVVVPLGVQGAEAPQLDPDPFQIRVTVRSASSEPVSTADVHLMRPDGSTVARVTADRNGRAVIRVPAPGAYRFEVGRLGYRDWRSGLEPLSPDGTLHWEVVLESDALSVDGVAAVGVGECNTPPEEGPTIVRLIELAQELFARVIRTEDEFPSFHARIIQEEPEQPRARFQVYDTSETTVHRSYRAPPAERTVANGVITPREHWLDSPGFHAVTPEVVVSQAFIESRCFRLAEHPDSGFTGLAYRPRPGSDVYDVKGTIWFDTIAPRPVSIEYHWTGLQDFLWDHELPMMRRARVALLTGEGLPAAWGDSFQASSARAGISYRNANRQDGAVARNVSRRITNMQRARETDYGGEIRFEPWPGGWVAGRSWMRWPGLPMPFHTLTGYTTFGTTREWDVMVSHRVLMLSVTVERVSWTQPMLEGRGPRVPLLGPRPLPERIRESLVPLTPRAPDTGDTG